MPCGCKQQPVETTTKMVQKEDHVEIIEKPNYELSELIRIENWLNSINKTKEDNEFIIDFAFRHFGEIINHYCDIPCQKRMRQRVDILKERLENYERH